MVIYVKQCIVCARLCLCMWNSWSINKNLKRKEWRAFAFFFLSIQFSRGIWNVANRNQKEKKTKRYTLITNRLINTNWFEWREQSAPFELNVSEFWPFIRLNNLRLAVCICCFCEIAMCWNHTRRNPSHYAPPSVGKTTTKSNRKSFFSDITFSISQKINKHTARQYKKRMWK